MSTHNTLAESLATERFAVTLEYAAPDRSEPADPLDALAEFAGADPRVAAIAVTDRVPTMTAHDPVDLAARAAEASGKTPLVHLAGKDRTEAALRCELERCAERGLWNVLLVTGDVPRVDLPEPIEAAPAGYVDSVQAIRLARETDPRFVVAAAVSSFKPTEPQQMMQYLKLRAKLREGAAAVFNQVGFDLARCQELPLWARREGLQTPLVAATYWPTPGFARFAAAGKVAGVDFTPDMVRRMEEMARTPDKGKAMRQEMLALHVLLARAFGYGGMYVGGFKTPGALRDLLNLVDQIEVAGGGIETWWHRWRELWRLEDGRPCRMAPDGVFRLLERGPEGLNSDRLADRSLPGAKPLMYRFMDLVHDVFFGRAMEPGGWARRLAARAGRSRGTARLAYLLERMGKWPLVGCEGCGSCTLPETRYVCIQHECAKKLPNGPCGGSTPEGDCEGRPGRECAWVEVYRRAKAAGNLDALLDTFVPPKDPSLEGTSSWINMALDRDHRGRGGS